MEPASTGPRGVEEPGSEIHAADSQLSIFTTALDFRSGEFLSTTTHMAGPSRNALRE